MQQAAKKIEAFRVDPRERWAFAGDLCGRMYVIDIDRFEITSESQIHFGSIVSISASPSHPYVACLSLDQTVSILRYDEHDGGTLSRLGSVSIRELRPDSDDEAELVIPFTYSQLHPLGFHDTKRRIVTRTANAGVLELEFDEAGRFNIVACNRFHGLWDLVMARYVPGTDQVLSASADGTIVLSEAGKIIRSWKIGDILIHNIEHLRDNEFLVSSDERLIARLDITKDEPLLIGKPFADDDVEQVVYNARSNKAYVASFDRKVYELDIETCAPTRIAFRAPFKCRWLHTLSRDPSKLIVQTRDGGLHKVNVESGKADATIKLTPPTLWTGVAKADGSIALAGDGTSLLHLEPGALDTRVSATPFSTRVEPLPISQDGYTKRMVLQESTGRMILGRTNGHVYVVERDGTTRLALELGGPVRDLAVAPDGPIAFVACEDHRAHKIDLDRGVILATYVSERRLPIWSLAYNPKRDVLVVSERRGPVSLLSGQNMSVISNVFDAGRSKRAKWLDDEKLVLGHGSELHLIDVVSGKQEKLLGYQGNSIEDFVWDAGRNYLVLACYTWKLLLYDFHNFRMLAEVRDQIDYTKGLIWVPPIKGRDTYPLDFLSFGRSGTAHRFRILNEDLVALGAVGPGLQNAEPPPPRPSSL